MARVTHVKRAQQRKNPDGSLKPNLVCEVDSTEIKPGDPYKWVSVKTGPRSSRKRVRCNACPTWQRWDLSNSLSARLEQVSYNLGLAVAEASDTDDAHTARGEAVEAIREIAEEKRESASNIEEGFGHPTSQSEELEGIADELESWAEEIEQADIPDAPEPEEQDCEDCDGAGEVDGEQCGTCDGEGRMTPDEATEDQMDEWRSEVQDALSIVDEPPV